VTLGRQRKNVKFTAVQWYDEYRSWPVKWMCIQLDVSRAGYYKWKKDVKPEAELENERIAVWVRGYDEQFNHTLGYRRMTGFMNRLNGTDYREKRIYRIMRKLGIHSVIRPKKKKYQRVEPQTIAENVLKREFNAKRPNERWVTDVTEFKWYEGHKIRKLYLSVILDLYDRSVVNYVVSRKNNNSLVFRTYDLAIQANPEARPISHSDRGFQYTNRVFQKKLAAQGITPSMSRVGHCIDNGPTEGFWGIVKSEMYSLRHFRSRHELVQAIDEFIEYYNKGIEKALSILRRYRQIAKA